MAQVNTILFGDADEWKNYSQLTSDQKAELGNSDTFSATINADGTELTIASMGITFTKQSQ